LLTVLPSQHQVELELSTKTPSKNNAKRAKKCSNFTDFVGAINQKI
jgi:hypothetical protein